MMKRNVFLVALAVLLVASTAGLFAGGAGEKATTAVPKLRMFMGNSGVPHPPGVNPSDNFYINVVKKYAGVDLELEVPGYEDFATKTTLMLASGDIPDVVHTWIYNEAIKAAESGAFLDLKSYYDKSPVVQSLITPAMLEYTKTASGHYFLMPMRWNSPAGLGNYARYDLLQKYNGGKWPTSVDEWIAALKTIKNALPGTIPISAHIGTNAIFLYGQTLWYYYGVKPSFGSRIQDGKILADFTLPEYRAAVAMWRQLYTDGILDPEFATNDQPKREQRVENNNVVLLTDSAEQPRGYAAYLAEHGHPDWTFAIAPPLKTYPSVLRDVKYTRMSYLNLPVLLKWHGVYVSAKSKYKDKAWKVVEAFASPELRDAIIWGQQGVQYNIVDGKRVADPKGMADPNHTWALHLAILWGFPTITFSPVKTAEFESKIGADKLKILDDGLATWQKDAEANGIDRTAFLPTIDEVSKKMGDADAFAAEAATQAIIGRISMDDFDAKVAEYNRTYGWIWDQLTKQFQDNKEMLRTNGVKTVDW